MSSFIHLATNWARMETWIWVIQRSHLSSFSYCLLRGCSRPTWLTSRGLFFFFAKMLLWFPTSRVKLQTICHVCSHTFGAWQLCERTISSVWFCTPWATCGSHPPMQATCHIFSFLTHFSSKVILVLFLFDSSFHWRCPYWQSISVQTPTIKSSLWHKRFSSHVNYPFS